MVIRSNVAVCLMPQFMVNLGLFLGRVAPSFAKLHLAWACKTVVDLPALLRKALQAGRLIDDKGTLTYQNLYMRAASSLVERFIDDQAQLGHIEN
jgi:hypothetical protein